jgi:hypothetical protein
MEIGLGDGKGDFGAILQGLADAHEAHACRQLKGGVQDGHELPDAGTGADGGGLDIGQGVKKRWSQLRYP